MILDWLTEESKKYLQVIYDFCSPQPQQHSMSIVPIFTALIVSVHLMMDLQDYIYDVPDFIKWGPLYIDLMPQEYWRLFTYSLHHASFVHLLGNVIFIVSLGNYVETKYGCFRTFVILFFSVIGGGIFAWMIKQDVLGASGFVYGLAGLYLVDLLVNPETVKSVFWHISVILTFVIAIIIDSVASKNISVVCHLGGGLSSMAASSLFLPNFTRKKYEWIICLFGLLFLLGWFVVAPVVLVFA